MERRLVLLIFFVSGASGLVYEVVWMRMITNVMGSSVYAVSTVLVAFMGGLAIGGALIGRIADRGWNGLHLYAALEFGVASWALLLPSALEIAEGLYVSAAPGPGGYSLPFRFLLSLALLLPPTILMGGTLPALGKFLVRGGRTAGAEIGGLYWVNTIGAALGCFAAGFLLIHALGIPLTNALAAAGNAAAGIGALLLGRRPGGRSRSVSGPSAPTEATPALSPRSVPAWLILTAIGISGFTALAYEVLWTRLLSTIFINTTYSFAAMLTVFLVGIAIGTFMTSLKVDRWQRLLILFGLAQGAVGILGLVSLGVFREAARIKNTILSLFGTADLTAGLTVEFLISVAVMLPPAVLLGAIFPIALKLHVTRPGRVGTSTGALVAANTLGAVLGSLAAGFVLIPLLGTRLGTIAVASLNLGLGLVLLSTQKGVSGTTRARWGGAAALGFFAALTLVPSDVRIVGSSGVKELIYYREGVSAAVSVVIDGQGFKRLKLNNHYALGGGAGLLIERRMGHLAVLLHPGPKRILLIGLGTGGTAGSVTLHPNVERIDALEISPEVVEAARLFARENHGLHRNPRVNIVVDDGRHYLKMAREPYDLIVADLFLPWHAGDGNLYTVDHYERARQSMAPAGVYVQWLPLYQLSVRQLGTIAATFRAVFPHTSLWLGALRTSTPVAALVGSERPLRLDVDRLEARLDRDGLLGEELRSIALDDIEAVMSLFVAEGDGLNSLTQGARLNRYTDPIIEFSAPADFYRQASLRNETLAAVAGMRRFPGSRLLLEADSRRLAVLERDYHATSAFLEGVLRSFDRDARGEREAYLKALAQTPRHRYMNQVLATMAGELIQRGQLEAVEDLCRKVVQINPLNYEAAANLGAALRLRRRYPESIAASKAAIALNGRLEAAYTNLGLAYAETGERRKALEAFRQVLAINPSNLPANSMVKRLEDR